MTLGKWFVYLILLALSPILFRGAIAGFVHGEGIRWVSVSDIITFGLILGITNVSELATLTPGDDPLRSEHIGISLLLVSFFAFLFAVSCFMELPANPIDENYVLYTAIFLSVVSVGFSYMVLNRITVLKG